ncbi:TolC family protein [Subsaximicrobium wynnwilliamsii]|uniref:TolC family protein n=1 Tax=Subsaximicrobium wynnwilliamsii TaxID=291179 RepID=A0A5C6ZFY6_9FLAO|nr:TolC family protein [Subsaximicrobium wynnwilliamsii]TXD82465.1 TolC family protein [Subsaximicrobium wynnwilliamsii]TXD88107.1 TolC family protein [Subsaximicrobium wynnwilliamsii]TXE02031.1 TolC family protein [Subsaximicrobium wynnwilliamsii]
MKKIVSLIIVLITLGVNAQNKKWTLTECVEHALENNISVKQSELNLEATDIDRLLALGNFMPSLNLSSSVSENTGLSFNPVTNNAQTTTFLSFTGRGNIGYTLFDGLRNIREVQRAKIAKLASQYRLLKMKDDISLLVANSFLQVILNKANLEVLQSQNEVTIEQMERTQQLVDAGSLPQGDLLEIRAINASELQNIVNAENQIQISLISLAQLLLIKDYETFDVQDAGYNIVDGGIADKSVSEIMSGARDNRSEIKIAEQDVELAKKDVQLAKGNYLPTLSAFFGYDTRFTNAQSFIQDLDPDEPLVTQQIGVVEATGQPVVGQFPNTITRQAGAEPFFNQLYQNDGIGYGLSLNIPIFNGFSTRSNVKRSEINLRRSNFQLEQAELDLESNVYQAYVDAKGSLKSYEAAKSAVESQELAYDYAKERYDVGLTNAFDFSQSKLRYDNSKIDMNNAKYDYIFKLKVLELYFGVPANELKF